MKTRTVTLRILPVMFAVAILFAACQKSDRTAKPTYSAAVQNQVIAATNEYYNRDVEESEDFDMIMGSGAYDDDVSGERFPSCYTVTYIPDRTTLPNTKIIDWGAGCTDPDRGVFKKGKIIIKKFDPAVTGGKISELSYECYQVDDFKYEGSTCAYIFTNSHGQTVRRAVGAKKLVDCSTGDYNEYIFDHDFTQTAGESTKKKGDDEFDVCGISLGRQKIGSDISDIYETNVDPHNIVKQINSCRIGKKVSGQVDIRVHIKGTGLSLLNEVLDYGDGTCNAKRSLSIEGGPFENIQPPLQYWPFPED